MKNNIVVNIPHSSTKLPRFFIKKTKLNKKIICEQNLYLSDLYVNEFALKPFNNKTIFKYSRLFCDVERFLDDSKEKMYEKGMGVIYTKTTDGSDFIDIDENYRKRVIENYYLKYHKKLDAACQKSMKKFDSCIIVDLHSFSYDLVYDLLKLENNPDFCIGYDEKFYSKKLVDFTVDFFTKKGYYVKTNYPYSGSMVPNCYYNTDEKRLVSIMIEINKRLYLDDKNKKNKNFEKIQKLMDEYFCSLKEKPDGYFI